jgi:hypothetical protein
MYISYFIFLRVKDELITSLIAELPSQGDEIEERARS